MTRKTHRNQVIILLIIAGIVITSGIAMFYFLQRTPSKSDGDDDGVAYTPRSKPRVNIYVNSTLYSSIKSDVDKYKQNATSQGFLVKVINWSDPNVANLKKNITYEYGNRSISGVILIGKIPYAMGRYWDTLWGQTFDFPTDMYLMDLDGTWQEVLFDGVYVIDPNPNAGPLEHSNGTGDWGPEIWLARIDPSSISDQNVHLTSIKDFFKRTREIRNGTLVRPNKAMLYIDNDWSYLEPAWTNALTAYTSNELDTYSNNALTNSTNYVNNLTLNYELVQLLVHSFPERHVWGTLGDGSEGTTWYNYIRDNNTLPLFYMLYACSACNYTKPDNIGTHYLFQGGSTVTVVGSARSGGVDLYKPFYDELKKGKTFGEGFYTWLQNPEIESFNKEPLYYGMAIHGDPLATILMT